MKIRPGAWLASFDMVCPRVAEVRVGSSGVLTLLLYSPTGKRIAQEAVNDRPWRLIQRPQFPLPRPDWANSLEYIEP